MRSSKYTLPSTRDLAMWFSARDLKLVCPVGVLHELKCAVHSLGPLNINHTKL